MWKKGKLKLKKYRLDILYLIGVDIKNFDLNLGHARIQNTTHAFVCPKRYRSGSRPVDSKIAPPAFLGSLFSSHPFGLRIL
jgi:hypothetical protein